MFSLSYTQISAVLVILLFAPQYPIVKMLVSYFLKIYHSPVLFVIHQSAILGLTFLTCCSLLICVVRDPGAIRPGEQGQSAEDENEEEGDGLDFMSALRMSPTKANIPQNDDDFNAPHKWCKKCWAPKPERTHHCSVCGRCVLKMGAGVSSLFTLTFIQCIYFDFRSSLPVACK